MILVVVAALLSVTTAHECIQNKIWDLVNVTMEVQPFDHLGWGADDTLEARKRRVEQATVATNGLRIHFDTFNIQSGSSKECDGRKTSVVVNNERIQCTQQEVLTQASKNMLLGVLNDLKTDIGKLLSIVRSSSLEI